MNIILEKYINIEPIKDDISNVISNNNFELTWGDKVYTTFKHTINILNDIPVLKQNIVEIIHDLYSSSSVEIFESWINITQYGGYQNNHIHYIKDETTILSGVYYIKTNSNDGNIIFDIENTMIKYNTKYIDDYLTIVPSIGKLLLFPSYVRHKVTKNNTYDNRISLAFNCKIL